MHRRGMSLRPDHVEAAHASLWSGPFAYIAALSTQSSSTSKQIGFQRREMGDMLEHTIR